MRRLRFLPALTLLLSGFLPQAGAWAEVSCSFNANQARLAIVLEATADRARIVRNDAAIEVWQGPNEVSCGIVQPTRTTTDIIEIDDDAPGSTEVTIDLTGGPFEPGASASGEGTSPEIEFEVQLGAGLADVLAIEGTPGPDDVAFGRSVADGDVVNLDADESTNVDADVTLDGVDVHEVHAAAGADFVSGQGGDGTGAVFDSPLTLEGGDDADDLTGGSAADILRGQLLGDSLDGAEGGDDLLGGVGTDQLAGGDGDDRLTGGPGDDSESGGADDDTFDQGATPDDDDELIGGEGDQEGDGELDVVAYDLRPSDLQVHLDGVPGSGQGAESDDIASDVEGVLGGAGDDDLVGNAEDNVLSGGPGGDSLAALGGDDDLSGNAGSDSLGGGPNGPAGDTADFAGASGAVTLDLGAGTATGEGNDTLTGIENAAGTAFNDGLTGDEVSNALTGRSGQDTVIGAAGPDELTGGAGRDELQGGPGNDDIDGSEHDDVLAGGPDDDELLGRSGRDAASYESAGGVEVDLAAGTGSGEGSDDLTGIEDLVGGPGDDQLSGDPSTNRLVGRGGDDDLGGAGGDDLLDGGPGDERMMGGSGSDEFDEGSGANGSDRMSGGSGSDTISYEDRGIRVTVSMDAQANDGAVGERDRVGPGIEQVDGGDGADRLTGDGGPNVLRGGAGADRLEGLAGRDRLEGGPGGDLLRGGTGRDRCAGGGGSDTLVGCET
jgi:RTX calcium-binding nonapeptide repeat (4 copies)